jgi:hypothetical protein
VPGKGDVKVLTALLADQSRCRQAFRGLGALAMDTCATKGDPCPARKVSATVFFSTLLPC